jgi:dihydroorotate dehydrogenase
MYSLIKPILFRLNPEFTHHLVLSALKCFYRPSIVAKIRAQMPRKPVKVMNLEFPNPVGLAAGFDNNADYIDSLFGLGFGFIEVGGVTPRPQAGNPKPRLFRLPQASALINRMGFYNKGVDYVVERLKNRMVPGVVGINIAKNKDTPLDRAVEDYQYCLTRAYPHVDYVTINISSPNTPGLRELQSETYLEKLIADLKGTQKKLMHQFSRSVALVVKLSVDLSDPELETIVNILVKYEIEGVMAANTSIDHQAVSRYPHGAEVGGLSGQPVFQKSTEMVHKIYQMTSGKLPIIGLGGILKKEHAQAKFNAGASLVQVYTGLVYRGPRLVKEIVESFQIKE